MTLRTLDEAANELGFSIMTVATTVRCTQARLAALLAGHGSLRGLSTRGRNAVVAHRLLLVELAEADQVWLLDNEIEGALSYVEAGAA